MIYITGNAPARMTVEFGDGTIGVGTASCEEQNLVGVLMVDLQEKHKIMSLVSKPMIQDKPATIENISRRSVLLCYPKTKKGIRSIEVLINNLHDIQREIRKQVDEKAEKKAGK